MNPNNPFAYRGYYREGPVPVMKVGPRRWRFVRDWTWQGVTIPRGYEIDGGTIPRPFWWVASPATEGFRAFAVHDYRHHEHMTWRERSCADYELFRNLRSKERLNIVRSSAILSAVRAWAFMLFWTFERE